MRRPLTIPLSCALEEHGRTVLRVCTAILGDTHLGADAAQETWLRFLRTRERAELENVGGWLRRAAVSSAIDIRRRRPPTPARVEAVEIAAPPRSSPPDLAALHEIEARLQSCLPELPESQRVVFRLRHEAGLTLSEIASCLGLSLPTVKTHFARACVRIQTELRSFRPEGSAP